MKNREADGWPVGRFSCRGRALLGCPSGLCAQGLDMQTAEAEDLGQEETVPLMCGSGKVQSLRLDPMVTQI